MKQIRELLPVVAHKLIVALQPKGLRGLLVLFWGLGHRLYPVYSVLIFRISQGPFEIMCATYWRRLGRLGRGLS